MLLITKEIKKQLEKNAAISENSHLMPEIKIDHKPVLKLFSPVGAATWLLTELKEGIAFGLCDLGQGTPELGYVSINELENIKLAFGLKIERDLHFTATKTISEYATDARNQGSIAA
tara:strand:+ start:842 stop:1192 length:351 start_codon:yes stop_codon:yes gene_type:complete